MRKDAPRKDNSSARPDVSLTQESIIADLEELVDSLEAIDWQEVPKIQPPEVAAFCNRIDDSTKTMKRELPDEQDGGDDDDAPLDHESPPEINLDRDHHNGHLNEEKQDFDPCFPVVVHCRSRDEALAVAKLISGQYPGGQETDGDQGVVA